MSLDIVGRENLPNVYIKEISLDSYGSSRFLLNPIIFLKDIKDGNSKFQWYENANLRKKWRQGHDIDNLSKEYYS